MIRHKDLDAKLDEILGRLERLDRENELLRTVLIVKEPETIQSANAYEGLRKQVIAAVGERRTHLAQLTAMSVALERAGSLADLAPQLEEWLGQAGVTRISDVPDGARVQDFFEGLDGEALDDDADLEVIEPAYVDDQTGLLLRLGRARHLKRVQPDSPPTADDTNGSGQKETDQGAKEETSEGRE